MPATFAAPPSGAAAAMPTPAQAPTMSLFQVMLELGQQDRSDRWQVAYATKLIELEGFPAPLPCYRGGAIERGVTRRSSWRRADVMAWLAHRAPPGAAAIAEAAQARAAGDLMDQRAAQLARTARATQLRLVGGAA